MSFDIKKIHIGNIIHDKVKEKGLSDERIQKFFKCSYEEVNKMYKNPSIDTDILLKWSKFLRYDFFRIYVQHVILFSPPKKNSNTENGKNKIGEYRKNIYTKVIIDFMLELINKNIKTKAQIIEEYNIPKTTLYKWIEKYGSQGAN